MKQYLWGPYAQKHLEQLTPDDKTMIRDIVFDIANQKPFNDVFSAVMSEFQNKGKTVHIETVKQSVHYYMKQYK